MVRAALMIFGVVVGLGIGGCSRGHGDQITQEELVRRTQQIFDAAATGDRTPWEKYFAPDSMYFDEKGRSMNKQALARRSIPAATRYTRDRSNWSGRKAGSWAIPRS